MESNPFFAIACVLDPRYKLRCFSSSSKAVAAQQMLMEAYEKLQPSEPTTKRPRVNSSLLNCVQEMMEQSSDSESEPDSPDVVIAAYLKEPNLPMFELITNPLDPDNPTNKVKDPLLYWKQNEVSNPILAKLARRFVSPPPGSVPSERLFSTAADIATDKRNRLLPNKVEINFMYSLNFQC